MNIGDTIIIQDVLHTVWLIEGNVYHLVDVDGNGRCYIEPVLLTLEP